jgi:uncharacterized membrane protein
MCLMCLAHSLVGHGETHGKDSSSGNTESALEILKKRYARGEINQEEYEKMKKILS